LGVKVLALANSSELAMIVELPGAGVPAIVANEETWLCRVEYWLSYAGGTGAGDPGETLSVGALAEALALLVAAVVVASEACGLGILVVAAEEAQPELATARSATAAAIRQGFVITATRIDVSLGGHSSPSRVAPATCGGRATLTPRLPSP
jgi:hypothetical protein